MPRTTSIKAVRAMQPLNTLKGHDATVNRVSWSPDGKLLASASDDETIRLWDVETGKAGLVFKAHKGSVTSVAWSPDGNSLASGSYDTTIKLWSSNDGKLERTVKAHSDVVTSVRWSPDGKMVASTSRDKTIRVWNRATGKFRIELVGHSQAVTGVAWLPDTSELLSASWDGTIRIWSTTTAASTSIRASDSRITGFCLYPSDHLIAVYGIDHDVGIWDRETGTKLHALQAHTGSVLAASFSNDGRLLATLSVDQSLCLWDCTKWEIISQADVKLDALTWLGLGMAFSPSSAILALPDEDQKNITLWRVDFEKLFAEPPAFTSVHYSNAKIILVGEASTGKTCLARALMGLPFEPQQSTHGMKVWDYYSETITQTDGRKIKREILLWDLAGQSDYQVIHQLFLDDTSLAIILFDATHPENPFGGVMHWKRALRRIVGEECPCLLVAGRVDRGYPIVTDDEIKAFCSEHGFDNYIATSANTGEGIETLREAITSALNWSGRPVFTSPDIWQDIREFLLLHRSTRHLLSQRDNLRETFRRDHPDAEFDDAEFNTVISHMQAQGLVWQLSFGDFILLKPEVLNDYASAVVRVARNHPAGIGSLAERAVLEAEIDFGDLVRLTDYDTEKLLLHAVVELFLNRELALREGKYLVFPSKFKQKRPDSPDSRRREESYRFAGPVEDIYATLVVRLFYSGAFELKRIWKDSVEFSGLIGGTCGLLLDSSGEGQGNISIYFDSDVSIESRVLFGRFIHEHLQARALPGSVARDRLYRCPKCHEEVRDARAVQRRLSNGQSTIFCQYCDEQILLADNRETMFDAPGFLQRVRELEEGVKEKKQQEVRLTMSKAKGEIREFDVFLAHNSADKEYVHAISEELKRRGLNPWLDQEQIPPGRWFQDIIQEAIPTVKSAAIFIGPTGIDRWEEVELRTFISECVNRKIPVIPVLLPGVKEIPPRLLFLRELNWVSFAKSSLEAEALDSLEWGVTGKRPQRTQTSGEV